MKITKDMHIVADTVWERCTMYVCNLKLIKETKTIYDILYLYSIYAFGLFEAFRLQTDMAPRRHNVPVPLWYASKLNHVTVYSVSLSLNTVAKTIRKKKLCYKKDKTSSTKSVMLDI